MFNLCYGLTINVYFCLNSQFVPFQGSKLDIFHWGPSGPRSVKRGGPNKNPGGPNMQIYVGGSKILGPLPQKPGGHLENRGGQWPLGPREFRALPFFLSDFYFNLLSWL